MNMGSATAEAPQLVRASLSFARALDLGDVEAATACFARNGCLVTPDATAVHGRDRIRPLLAQLIARRTEIEVELSSVVGAGDVVLAHERWRVHSGGPEGQRVEQILSPTLVLRQIEGEWKLAIAAPWARGSTTP
jgi:ketosteroid isomerase-like protein